MSLVVKTCLFAVLSRETPTGVKMDAGIWLWGWKMYSYYISECISAIMAREMQGWGLLSVWTDRKKHNILLSSLFSLHDIGFVKRKRKEACSFPLIPNLGIKPPSSPVFHMPLFHMFHTLEWYIILLICFSKSCQTHYNDSKSKSGLG